MQITTVRTISTRIGSSPSSPGSEVGLSSLGCELYPHALILGSEDEFKDVSTGDKAFMTLWNRFAQAYRHPTRILSALCSVWLVSALSISRPPRLLLRWPTLLLTYIGRIYSKYDLPCIRLLLGGDDAVKTSSSYLCGSIYSKCGTCACWCLLRLNSSVLNIGN